MVFRRKPVHRVSGAERNLFIREGIDDCKDQETDSVHEDGGLPNLIRKADQSPAAFEQIVVTE